VSTQISLEISPVVALIAEKIVKLLRRPHGVAFSLDIWVLTIDRPPLRLSFCRDTPPGTAPIRSFFAAPIDNHVKQALHCLS